MAFKKKISDVDKRAIEARQKMMQGLAQFDQFVIQEEVDSGERERTPEELAYEYASRSEVPPPPQPPKDPKFNPFGIVDIETFASHPHYLGMELYPWQNLILKIFYKGSEGNTHLEIGEERPTDDTDCTGCIWQFNKRSEDQQVAEIAEGSIPGTARMLPENSPCLFCSRFGIDKRKIRFDYLLQNTITDEEMEEIEFLKNSIVTDCFQTEMDLLNDEQIDENVRNQIKSKIKKKFGELVLVLGRRSGKSLLVSIIALYEVYKLLMMGCPQKHYGMNATDQIVVLNVAKSEEQAKAAIFDKVKNAVATSPYLSKLVGHDVENQLYFKTPADIEESDRRVAEGISTVMHGTIICKCGHSASKSLLGGNIKVVIIDEMAAMTGKDGESGNDFDLYALLKPSLATFGREGKMISISNPMGPQGKLFELYKTSFKLTSCLMFQLPTWLANPNIEKAFLRDEEIGDPYNFPMQYGAEFGSGSVDAFIPAGDVERAFLRGVGKKRTEFGRPLVRYFAHLDPAYSSDYYTLVVVHAEPSDILGADRKPLPKIIVDHIHYFKPLGKNHPIAVEEVDKYAIKLGGDFNMAQLSYDHFNSVASIQKLRQNRLNAVEKAFSPKYQEMIFQQLLDLFQSDRIEFYNTNTLVQKPNGDWELLNEVEEAKDQFAWLQKRTVNNRPKIAAAKNHRDDIPDCVAAAAYECLCDKQYSVPARTLYIRSRRFF